MTWKHDPGIDPEALAEVAAKRADAFDEAKRAALAGDWIPARQLAVAAQPSAERVELDTLAPRIEAAADVLELAALAPRDVLAPLAFGAELPRPVLWPDTGNPGVTPEQGGTVLCAGEVAILSGPGEAGKSTVSVALAHAAREGGTACGLHVAADGSPCCPTKTPAPSWPIGSPGTQPRTHGRTFGELEARPRCGKPTRTGAIPAPPRSGGRGGTRWPTSAPGSL